MHYKAFSALKANTSLGVQLRMRRKRECWEIGSLFSAMSQIKSLLIYLDWCYNVPKC